MDNRAVHGTIMILGAVVLGTVTTMCLLALRGDEIPALISGLATATIALLVPSPMTKLKKEPAPVEVVNPAPIPVTDTPAPTGVAEDHVADGLDVIDLT